MWVFFAAWDVVYWWSQASNLDISLLKFHSYLLWEPSSVYKKLNIGLLKQACRQYEEDKAVTSSGNSQILLQKGGWATWWPFLRKFCGFDFGAVGCLTVNLIYSSNDRSLCVLSFDTKKCWLHRSNRTKKSCKSCTSHKIKGTFTLDKRGN